MTRTDGVACVVFDVDGVLIRSNVFKREAYFQVFADLPVDSRHDLVSRTLSELPHGDRFQVIGHVLRVAGGESLAADVSLVEEYAERYNTLCEAYAISCDEVPGAAVALTKLATMVPLYTNSATPQEPLGRVIAGRGWAGLFREVLGGPRSKTENLRHILRREGLAADELLFVGDEQRDYDAALNFGCRFIGLRNEQSNFSNALNLEFQNMYEVVDYLMRLERTEL